MFNLKSLAICAILVGIATCNLTADPVKGPDRAVDRVYAFSTNTYYVDCWGGETTAIEIVGDGDTDLDLHVYDSDYNWIASAESYDDLETLLIDVAYRDTLIIEVTNLGNVYNEYLIRVW